VAREDPALFVDKNRTLNPNAVMLSAMRATCRAE
jgi:hypothetical protein